MCYPLRCISCGAVIGANEITSRSIYGVTCEMCTDKIEALSQPERPFIEVDCLDDEDEDVTTEEEEV